MMINNQWRENTIWTIAGNGNRTKYSQFSSGLATEQSLNDPCGVAVHARTDEIFIADTCNHRIVKVSLRDNKMTTIAGTGTPGFSSDGGMAVVAQLRNPRSVVVHPKNEEVYFCDSQNHCVRKISLTYGTISTVAGNRIAGTSGDGGLALFAQLYYPYAVNIHPISGDIYIVDHFKHKIRRILQSNGKISTFAGTGGAGYNGEGILAKNSLLNGPVGIDFHPMTGDVYIIEEFGHRIRKVNPRGIISSVAGNGKSGTSGDGEKAINAQLCHPYGISICKKSGDIYFSERNIHRIRKISYLDGKISTICGTSVGGFDLNGSLATNARINYPSEIAIHPENGDIYFCDLGNNVIRRITSPNHMDSF